MKSLTLAAALLVTTALAVPAAAQTYTPPKARKHFVTFSYDWINTQPLHFAEHPLEDLVGGPVASAQFKEHDYEARDGSVFVDVLEFKRRNRGASVTVYPLGASVGATLAVKGAFEQLPVIRLAFEGTNPPPGYVLTGATALDAGAGIYVSDRAPGWGLGSHAYVGGGIGRIQSDLSDGRRIFAEGGGGLTSGPIGVELSVKFAWNTLQEPVEHRFLTIPVTIRGTVTF
jgi:hypothetical protein